MEESLHLGERTGTLPPDVAESMQELATLSRRVSFADVRGSMHFLWEKEIGRNEFIT